MRFTAVGRVHPERADVNIERKVWFPTTGGQVALCCEASQLCISGELPDINDHVTAFIVAKSSAQIAVSAHGFALGTGYSVEIVQLIDDSGKSWVFGVRPGNLNFSPWQDVFNLSANLAKQDFFFRFALQDYCQAISSEIDCASYCYRAIEGIKSSFQKRAGGDGWSAMHAALGTQRDQIDSLVKDFADPLRHGNWSELKPTTSEQRNAMLFLTREILHKYLKYVGEPMSPHAPNPNAYDYFYKIALEYYVAGRSALLCRGTLITGNLLHHAVEMLLKGQLSKTIPLEDIKNPKMFGHKLPKLWATFKALFPREDLTEFDSMIPELESFEKIRYPDEILSRGAMIGLGFGRGRPVTQITPGRPEPEYQMGTGDVDALFGRLFPLCGLNPKAYFSVLSALGRQILTEANHASGNWLP